MQRRNHVCVDNKHIAIQYYIVKSVIYVLGSALGQSRTGLSLIENIQQFVVYETRRALLVLNVHEYKTCESQLFGLLDLECL